MAFTWKDVLNLASKSEPQFRREFTAAVERLRKSISIKQLARAIGDRGLADAEEAMAKTLAIDGMLTVNDEVFRTAALRTAATLGIRFDITNPFVVKAARDYTYELVRVAKETQAAIRVIVTRSIEDRLTYRQAANTIRPMIGLTSRGVQAVANYRQGLVKLGLKPELIDLRVSRYAKRLVRERSFTIARTELMRASNAGQRAAWLQSQQAGHLGNDVQREWLVTPDDRLCPQCEAHEGERVALDEDFSEGDPPLHPRCRCTTILVEPERGRR